MDNQVSLPDTDRKSGGKIERSHRPRLRGAGDQDYLGSNKEYVQMLVGCPPTLAPRKMMQYLKGRSSKMLQEEFNELRKRYWGQHLWAAGYFIRTVGTVTEEMIKEYIANQGKSRTDEVFTIEE